MTRLGLMHYGGTEGLYAQPREEQVRALAYLNECDRREYAAAKARHKAAKR